MRMRTGSLIAALAGVLLSLQVAGSAHADSGSIDATVTVKHCNGSSSAERLKFPHHGNLTSTVITPGKCWSGAFSWVMDDQVIGQRQINGLWTQVATRYFSDFGEDFEFKF
ncbi:hypothetical protein [Streptomyces sp. NPDC098781]|uniref:hypothetical protein n=1 Tax=Streptomyces sp. NPDC098781 TaxID=3366097 RepID=UPI00382CD49E